jgi:hypothetical protein
MTENQRESTIAYATSNARITLSHNSNRDLAAIVDNVRLVKPVSQVRILSGAQAYICRSDMVFGWPGEGPRAINQRLPSLAPPPPANCQRLSILCAYTPQSSRRWREFEIRRSRHKHRRALTLETRWQTSENPPARRPGAFLAGSRSDEDHRRGHDRPTDEPQQSGMRAAGNGSHHGNPDNHD